MSIGEREDRSRKKLELQDSVAGLKVARSTILPVCNVTIYLCIHYGPMGESEGKRELRSGTFRFQDSSSSPIPLPQRERERLDRVAFPVGRPRATIARPAISIRRILGRKVGYRRPVTSAQWGVGIDLNSFGRFLFRPARVHHRNRGGCAVEYFHGSRGNCLPRNENIYSRNSPRNNAVFHPVPSFPLPAINLATMNRHLLLSSFPP